MRKLIFMTMTLVVLLLASSGCKQNSNVAATIKDTIYNGNKDIVYPTVVIDNKENEKKINNAILAEVERYIAAVNHVGEQEDSPRIAELAISYSVPYNQKGNNGILSIILTEYCYYEKAAHPSTSMITLNFNVFSGERMDTNYLTDVGSGNRQNYLNQLTRKLQDKVARGETFLFEDMLPLKNLPENFYFDENGHVHFLFQQYEIAPYAAGIIDIEMD